MVDGKTALVGKRCDELLAELSEFYGVPDCGIRVLAARPLRVRERWTSELFGDYSPDTMLIRMWMRTAVRKEVTSFGTFLSTLCHEFCHHLDFAKVPLPGFLAHAGVLRTGRRPLPWRAGDSAETSVLDARVGRAMAHRLAANQSWRLTLEQGSHWA